MGSSVGGAESCSPLSAERRNEDKSECLETFDSDMDFEDLLHKAATFFEAERTTLADDFGSFFNLDAKRAVLDLLFRESVMVFK